MKKRLYLYGILVLSVFLQVYAMKYLGVFPDGILLVVVFTGIFAGSSEGAVLGLVAGLLRGSFSPSTLGVDILLFPAVGAVSSLLARLFYRQNPTVQMFTAAVAFFLVVFVQTTYLNNLTGNEVSVFAMLLGSWKQFLLTVITVPFMFAGLRAVLGFKE